MSNFSLQYLDIISKEFDKLNLTRILELEEFEQKQFWDSLLPAQRLDCFKKFFNGNYLGVDIGFGGGFPILPLATHFTAMSFIGFDARNKKVDAVNKIARLMKINNVKTYHERVENIFFDLDTVMTFKAVGKIDKFLNLIYGKGDINIFFYKSLGQEKIDGFKHFKLICNESIEIPGKDKITRRILGYKMTVPRGTSKKLKKVSEFLKK